MIAIRLWTFCDDQLEIRVNGRQVLIGGEKVSTVDLEVNRGDWILAKCVNTGGGYGFACVIKPRQGEGSIATTLDGDWRVYEPQRPEGWFDPKAMRNLQPVNTGNAIGAGMDVSKASGVPAQTIWGTGNTCYLCVQIR